ncbi:MAG TPA: hypothetical protein VIV58_19370 [Kofleriaceae bacterium]
MRIASLMILAFATTAAPACKSIDCGTGTIERDGTCAPADETVGAAKCGPFTMIQGDQCVPIFPPAICDPTTTTEDTGSDGVITCKGNGMSGGCSADIACPNPSSGKQTICGQIYNFADGTPFRGAATGAACAGTETSGPCALQIVAYDAVVFAHNSTMMPPVATTPQSVGKVVIDDCGRYAVEDISPPGGPFLALGFDDRGQPLGPSGVTVTTGVAMSSAADTRTQKFEAFVLDQSVIGSWTASGGPPFASGIYAAVYRAHTCDGGTCVGDSFANQSGVSITKALAVHPENDFYFKSTDGQTRQNLDTTAATSVNGTGLLINASVDDSLAYSGTGGITDTTNCQWESHAAANVPGLLFIQIYRKTQKPFKTCTE